MEYLSKKFTAVMSFKVSSNTVLRCIKDNGGKLTDEYGKYFEENMGKYIKNDFREVNSFKEAQERFMYENPVIFAEEDVQISIMPLDENGRLELVSLDVERDTDNLYPFSLSFRVSEETIRRHEHRPAGIERDKAVAYHKTILGQMRLVNSDIYCSFDQAYNGFKDVYPEIIANEFCMITAKFDKPEKITLADGEKTVYDEIHANYENGDSNGNSGKYFGMLEFKISQRTIEREYENTPSPNADGTIDAYEKHMGEFESFCSRFFNSYEEAERFYETNYPTIWEEEETQITLRRVKKVEESTTKISDDIFATDF